MEQNICDEMVETKWQVVWALELQPLIAEVDEGLRSMLTTQNNKLVI